MATPIDYAASDFLGDSVIPRPRTVFTPAAFAESTSIAERARLAQRNLRTSLAFAESESKMRDYILQGQEQDVRAQQLKSQAEMFAMQPALQQDLTDIDPTDDDALDRLNEIEPMLTSPQDQRRARIMRSVASNFRRQVSNLLQDMQGIVDPDKALEISRSAKEAFRNGDPDAFDKKRLEFQTFNERQADLARIRKEEEAPEREADAVLTKVAEDLRTAGGVIGAGAKPDVTKTTEALKSTLTSLSKSLPDLDPGQFLSDPEAVLATLGAGEDSKTKSAITQLEKLVPRVVALRQYEAAKKARAMIEARKRQALPTGKPVASGGVLPYPVDLQRRSEKPK